MNEKEIAEIRRRFKPDKNNITHVHGCYVNEKREIIARFSQSLTMSRPEESEKLLGILRKTLSGTVNKNLLDIEFDTKQVADSDEHRLLMRLRETHLQDEEAVEELFRKLTAVVTMEGNYMILLAHDTYDVPYRGSDGENHADRYDEVFSYILCSICPVKLTKEGLGYYVYENQFRSLQPDWAVSAPEMGFLFPSFDDRATNLYDALYYTRDTKENHPEVVDAL